MTGLSYYPVTASGVTISSATIKFYNEQIEGGELVAGGDGLVRSTRTDTQHEYMHCGLLYNTEDLTVTNVTVKGTVGSEADGSGFLVRGTLWNSTGNYTDITGVTLDNALVRSGATAAGTASGYAPLLINKAGNNDLDKPTNLTLTTVSTANYASAAVAASSLIGNVSGTDIQLTFSDMRLDARTGLLGTAADAVLAEKYGTTQSIFTTATLLNSFTHTDASSEGRYNFSLAEDWSGSTAVHHVAYGKEISGSVEYAAVTQDEYFDQAVKINPASSSGGAYNFNTSSWLPYVAAGYDAGSHTHELRINQKLASFSEGCGKCDDPYIITDGDQLVSVASIIRGDPVDTTFELVLPDSLTPNTVHTASGTGSKANDATYSYNDSLDKFTSDTAGTPQYTVAAVREYLAGAYYSISQDITIPDTGFTGLGAVNTDYTDYLCPYAFRGVILGNTHTITNQTSSPLIANSNGAVVKQLRVTVQKAYTVAKNNETDNTTLTFRYSGGMDTYGALIGKVMGGDTFIDNVNVTFDISAGSISASGTAARLVPVGSYIGVVVNGGVIFRNMPANAGSAFGTYCTAVSNSGWLYANPVIGRVIAGYAFSEDNAVDNGSKNYEIPVLDKNNANKLTMSTSSAVSVPDGQAVWVLGAIINSGAGAASGYNKVYPSDKSVWSAYRNYTAARSGASDYADCVYNAPTTKKAYIVQQYTTGNYVRAIGGLSGLTVTLTGNCTVPKGFRGIGGFYKDDNSLRLSINEFNGGNYTVTLDVRFLEYVDSSAKLFENYRAIAGCAGLGLFNTIGTGGTGAAAASLHNLTIAGSIYYDVKDTSGNTTYAWNNYESGQGVNLRSLSTGGLVGYIVDRNFRIRNIKLDGLTVEGARYAGGVVGRISTSKSGFSGEISQCGTGESGGAVTVRGGFSAGGLVGRLFAIKRGIYTFVCDGDLDDADPLSIRSSGKSLMKINEVRSLGTVGDSETYRNFAFSAGGLYGFVQSSNNQTTVNGSPTGGGVTFTFSDFEVRGGTVACNYAYSNNRNDNGRSGGVIGTLAHSNSDISGIKVKNVNVDGFYAGGLVGKSQTGWLFESRAFSDIVIDGSPAGEGSDALIDGDTSAGGIFGFFEIHDNTTTEELQITDCHVSHYTIGSTKRSLTTRTTKNYYTGLNAAGGIFGDFFLHAEETVNFANLSVKDCTIFISSLNSNYTSTANLHGAGGIAGLFQPQTATTTRVITGHNIVVTNTAVENRKYASESATEYTVVKNFCGTLFGWNGDGSTKFTGVTAYGTTMSADGSYAPVGYRSGSNDYGPEGYVIFADHEGVSVSNSANTSDNMLFTSGDLTADDPYVTVNPGFAIDSAGHLLTGDGMVAATLRKLLTAADSRYDHALAKSGILTGATLTDRLSTYKTEFGITGDSGPDVTFLVINASESHADVTGAINSCLNLLSNTQYDFTDLSDTADICTVTVKRMVRSGGNFILSGSDDASVFVDNLNHRFSVRKGLVDNNRDSFTLIDVAFLDPYEPTDVAYHLYLPVFVKKVLEFEFTSYVMPDTTYRAADYAGHKQVLENFGTPVTLCFTYTYARSTSEWITALSIGDNLLGNYNKSITLTKYGSVDPLPAGTRLVLVDAQTGRPYYMTLGANFSGALDLADFVAADGTTHFEPVSISGRLNVSAGLDPLGEAPFMRCPENDANVLVQATDGYFYRLYTEEDGEQDRYSLSTSVSNLSETYYLSVFTDVDDTGIARYTVDCPTHLSDSYPTTCISGDTPRRSDLILGQVYTMSISSFTTSGGDSENVLDRTNDSITANMEASVRLNNGSIYSAFVGSIYHSFLVHLTRTDAEGSRTAIVGEPTVSGTYSIDGGAATAYRNGSDDEWTASGGYARFTATQNLNGSLTNPAKNYTATISATVTIDYNSNESSIEEQFPAKPADTMSDTTTGTTVFVKSNIASSPERTEYSSTSIRADDGLANRYFSKPMNKEAQLSYNTVSHSFIYDLAELGINPLDEDNETSSLVETVAVLDFGAAKDQSAGYTHLKLSMSLAQKNDGYTAELDLSEYFDSLTIAGASVTLTGNAIEILLPKTKTGYPGLTFSADGYQATIPINFYVKTGAALESAGKYYSNYKVTLDVDLVKVEGNNEILLVNANPNYIIYTNARILPDFIG